MDEPAIVLQALRDELAAESRDIVGSVELDGATLLVKDGQARLSVLVRNDPGSDPSVAHCHIVTQLGGETSGHLDACVIGVDSDRAKALQEAAHSWKLQVAGPIVSLLHARPVLDANHFDGTQPMGVSGCHGFLGRIVGRAFEEDFEPSILFERPVFEFAAEMAPSGLVHLAKATLTADGNGFWNRTVEVDGHEAVHVDTPWTEGPPAPRQGIISVFAAFHYADQPKHIEERRKIDETTRRFASALQIAENSEDAGNALINDGVDADLAHRVAAFLPLAFARVLLSQMPVRLPSSYVLVTRRGTIDDQQLLMHEPVFARSIALGWQFFQSEGKERFMKIAMESPELQIVNDAFAKGKNPENLKIFPAVVPERGASQEAFDRGMALVASRGAEITATAKKAAKPWWRFW